MFSVSANAYFIRGSELATQMKEYDKAEIRSRDTKYYGVGNYAGFIYAVHDAYELNNITCSGSGVTKGQVLAIVAKYLKATPERWNEPAFNLVADALKGAFPCPTK